MGEEAQPTMTANSFGSRATLEAGGATHEIYRLDAVAGSESLPYSLKVLLENLLRNEDGENITTEHINALASWDPKTEPDTEIQFTPARVILQDLTGVPAVVDLAAMREAMREPRRRRRRRSTRSSPPSWSSTTPWSPTSSAARTLSSATSRWSSSATASASSSCAGASTPSAGFRVVPPGTGIVHQVNIEHLARVVMTTTTARRIPTPASAPTATPPCRTASASSAGASAASRRRRPCSASRSPC